MAIITTNSKNYYDIADAIRAKGISGSFTPAQMANAVSQIKGGGGGVVTGTFTLPASQAGGLITHNSSINGEYIFLAVMQTASFEELKSSESTKSYAIAFCVNCTSSLTDFTIGNNTAYVNKNGVRWNFTPSSGVLSGSISAPIRMLMDDGWKLHFYDSNNIKLAANFGYHKGTYDFWAIPLK